MAYYYIKVVSDVNHRVCIIENLPIMTAVLIYYTDAKVTLRFDKQGLSEGMALFPMERLGSPQDYH